MPLERPEAFMRGGQLELRIGGGAIYGCLRLIRLHPIYMITGDPYAPLRTTRAVYTPRGDTHAPDMKPP
jgi:hypothetical protein